MPEPGETSGAAEPTVPPADDARAAATAAPADGPLLTPEFVRRLDQLTLVSKKIFVGRMKGERKSPRRGESVEFADYRNYVIGDDLRFVDWNVYGRLEKLFLKLFLEEEDLHIALVLDASASMSYGEPDKLHYAKQVVAALGYIGLSSMDRISVYTAGARLGGARLTGIRGRRSAHRLFGFLDELEGAGETDLERACREFALTHRTKGIVILVSDFLDKRGYDGALRYLLMSRSDLICVHVLAPDEVEPDLTADLRLIDLEDNSVAEVTRSDTVLEAYKRRLRAFCDGLKDACVRRDILYLYALTDQPFENICLTTLRRYGLVR